MANVKAIPEGYPRVTPYLCVDGADSAIAFYKEVFGADERMRMPGPDGKIGHAELQIGNSVVMLADEYQEMEFRSPRSIGGTPVTVHLYVEDADAVFEKALERGATSRQPLEDRFYGDRSGQFEDPFGHRWNVATHIEDVPAEELSKRAAEMMEVAQESA